MLYVLLLISSGVFAHLPKCERFLTGKVNIVGGGYDLSHGGIKGVKDAAGCSCLCAIYSMHSQQPCEGFVFGYGDPAPICFLKSHFEVGGGNTGTTIGQPCLEACSPPSRKKAKPENQDPDEEKIVIQINRAADKKRGGGNYKVSQGYEDDTYGSNSQDDEPYHPGYSAMSTDTRYSGQSGTDLTTGDYYGYEGDYYYGPDEYNYNYGYSNPGYSNPGYSNPGYRREPYPYNKPIDYYD